MITHPSRPHLVAWSTFASMALHLSVPRSPHSGTPCEPRNKGYLELKDRISLDTLGLAFSLALEWWELSHRLEEQGIMSSVECHGSSTWGGSLRPSGKWGSWESYDKNQNNPTGLCSRDSEQHPRIAWTPSFKCLKTSLWLLLAKFLHWIWLLLPFSDSFFNDISALFLLVPVLSTFSVCFRLIIFLSLS